MILKRIFNIRANSVKAERRKARSLSQIHISPWYRHFQFISDMIVRLQLIYWLQPFYFGDFKGCVI